MSSYIINGGTPGYCGSFIGLSGGGGPPLTLCNYAAENGTDLYVAENGTDFYVGICLP
jgi:hypothetical protein